MAKTKAATAAVNAVVLEETPMKRKRTLWEMVPDIIAIDELLDETGGELSGPQGATLEKWLNDMGEEAGTKLDGYVHVIRVHEANEQQAAAEAKSYYAEGDLFASRAKVESNIVKRLKKTIHDWMVVTGQTKIVTTKGRVLSVRNNGGADYLDPATLDPTDPELAPYVTMKPVIDEAKVLADMKTGKSFARVRCTVKGSHFRID